MSGVVLASVSRPVPDVVVRDEDQLMAEKIAAYADFVNYCNRNKFGMVGEVSITLDTALFTTVATSKHAVVVSGWVFVNTNHPGLTAEDVLVR